MEVMDGIERCADRRRKTVHVRVESVQQSRGTDIWTWSAHERLAFRWT